MIDPRLLWFLPAVIVITFCIDSVMFLTIERSGRKINGLHILFLTLLETLITITLIFGIKSYL